jgi:hypothetical protein
MSEPEVTSHQRWWPPYGGSRNPPEVVASAAGEEVTRSGLGRAYLLLARRPAGRRPAGLARYIVY